MGKSKRIKQEKSKFITLGKLAWLCYERHGKGICAYQKDSPFVYIQSEKYLQSGDFSFLKRYDPGKEFLLTYTLGDVSDLWITGIFSYSDEKAAARIIIPKDSSLETILENCLL